MNNKQFHALSTVLRLRPGTSLESARQVFVYGLSTPDAARAGGATYPLTYRTVARIQKGLDLIKIINGDATDKTVQT